MEDFARNDQPSMPLILFSGMGADDRVFASQREAVPNLIVPQWIQSQKDESIADYAARFATSFDCHRPCILGGASFGGFVAIEMCRHLNAQVCLLIGSVRSPTELRPSLLALRRAASVTRRVPFEMISRIARALEGVSRPLTSLATRSFLRQIADSDADFLRWALRAVLLWQGRSDECKAPIHHIHGDRDRILPHRYTKPEILVEGGGHLLTLSHPAEVNAFIRDVIAQHRA